MTFQALKRAHPGQICVCRPHIRDAANGQVVSWICLQAFDSVDAAEAALKRFEQDGAADAVLISTTSRIPVDPTRTDYETILPVNLKYTDYNTILSDFKDAICRNPEADFTQMIGKLAYKFTLIEKTGERHAVNILLLNLYPGDPLSLQRDIMKAITGGTKKVVPSQREELFQFVCGVFGWRTPEDFYGLLEICDRDLHV